jgi:hypothetical protein
MNRPQSLLWHQEIDEWIPGRVVRTSYFGFAQSQLTKCWPLVLELYPEIKRRHIQPVFLTFEVSQFLMAASIKKYAHAIGALSQVWASTDRMAIELTGILARAALAGVPYSQIGDRLFKGSMGTVKADYELFKQVDLILQDYRLRCLEKGCLDYGLVAEIYNMGLLKEPQYEKFLRAQFTVVLVDNLEEMTVAAANLLSKILPYAKGALLCFCHDGGYSRFYGAQPDYVIDTIDGMCEERKMVNAYTCCPEIFRFADHFAEGVLAKKVSPYPCNHWVEWEIDVDLRSDMLDLVAKKLISLVNEEGVPADEIAVIAPFVDPVMEGTMSSALGDMGIGITNSTRRPRAKDNPFVKALVTLACLAHPGFGILPTMNDISDTVSLCLGMDPIRSAMVARVIMQQKPYMFPNIDDVLWRERIGFSNSERYEYIRNWLLKYMEGEPEPIDIFFRRVFIEILISLPAAHENLMACQQLMDSAASFLEGLEPFDEFENPNREFVNTILQGSKGAEGIIDVKNALNAPGILFTTPLHYLMTTRNRRVQVWCDIRSGGWVPREVKTISNPYVLSADWQPSQTMTPELEEWEALNKLAVVVRCLLRRCQERVILASSRYSSQGYEDDGILAEFWLQALQQGMGSELK